MPISNLPKELQKYFLDTKNKNWLNLENYPLNSLSLSEFKEFIAVLKEFPKLKWVLLTNCGLDKLKLNQLWMLLTSLSQFLVGIDLKNNGLIFNQMKLRVVYRALHSMPALHFFSIHSKEEQQQQQLPPNVFANLRTLPTLRICEEEDSNIISFLNREEIDALLDFIENKCGNGWDYFANPQLLVEKADDEATKLYKKLTNKYNNILKSHAYRVARVKQHLPLSQSVTQSLSVIDQLQNYGVSVQHYIKEDFFVINLEHTHPTAYQQVTTIIENKLPKGISCHFQLPSTPIGHFAMEIFRDFISKRPDHFNIIKSQAYLLEQSVKYNKLDKDYSRLKFISELFSLNNNDIYTLFNSRHYLFKVIARLDQILKSNKKELHALIHEFFVIHKLYQVTNGINNLESLNDVFKKTNKQEAINYMQSILALLSTDTKMIAEQLHLAKNISVTNAPLNSHYNKFEYHLSLQAKAFWGKAAYYDANLNSSQGIYWYGRFLHEYPMSQCTDNQIMPYHDQFAKADTVGLYWIRLAATHYNNREAALYLGGLLSQQDTSGPADRYQLLLACEELKIPLSKGEKYTTYSLLLSLVKERGFFEAISDVYKKIKFSASDNGTYEYKVLKENEFYLTSLLNDNLISESAKVELLNVLLDQRVHVMRSVSFTSQQHFKENKDQLFLYHATPLGVQIKSKLLPLIIKTGIKHNQIQPVDANYQLPNDIIMKDLSLEARLVVFCRFIETHLELYMKDCTLFGTKVPSDQSPSYVATLIHNLLTHTLDFFELKDTEIATSLFKTMQEIKYDILDRFFRQQLNEQPLSLGFTQALTKRMVSYSTTAYVANINKMSFLSKFGEEQTSDEEPHKGSWLKKGLHIAALGIEVVHVALPIIIAVTSGAGIPVAIASYFALEGLIVALKQIHHYVEVAEKLFESAHVVTDAVLGIAHIYHLSHEAELLPHDHHPEPTKMIDIDVIKHLNDLLLSAACKDVDNVWVLIRHWTTIYKPITDELTETSSTILGILLVELLLRGLTIRLLEEKQSIFKRKRELPTSIPDLLDYFNETIWCYSRPSICDNTQLMTRGRNIFSALDVIFPQQLKAYLAGEEISIKINANKLPGGLLRLTDCPISRFASTYEINQLNEIQHGCTNTAFILQDSGHALLAEWDGLDLLIAYDESNTLAGNISLLTNKVELMQLGLQNQTCMIHLHLLSTHSFDSPQEIELINSFKKQLSVINQIIVNSMRKLDTPNQPILGTLDDMGKLAYLNQTLSPKESIIDYHDKATAFFILIDHKYKLDYEVVHYIPLAKMDDKHLERLLEPIFKQFDYQISQDKLIKSSPGKNGLFSQNNSVIQEESSESTKDFVI